MTKQLLKFICTILLVFLFVGKVWSNHIIGGEITYKYLSGNKYSFLAKVYRDCADCKFNGKGGGSTTSDCPEISDLQVYTKGGIALKGKITLTRMSIKDQTPVCSSVQSVCNGGTGFGYEVHYMEGTFDFTSVLDPDNCEFDVVLSMDSRDDAYGSSFNENFFNYARINLCVDKQVVNSPFTDAPIFHYLVLNKPFYYSTNAVITSGDSISYKLVPALISFKKQITYGSFRSSSSPVTPYCDANCTPDPDATLPNGLYCDASNGFIAFTPTLKDEAGFFVIQIEDWRKVSGKWELMGYTRRDFHFVVVDLPSNNPPVIRSAKYAYEACAGQTIGVDISVSDKASSFTKDNVSISLESEILGATLTKIPSGNPNAFDAAFTWKPGVSDARLKPYYFIVSAKDDGCPLNLNSSRIFSIKVNPEVSAKLSLSKLECGTISSKVSDVSGAQSKSVNYFLFNETMQLLDNKSGDAIQFNVEKGGKYFVRMSVVNTLTGCSFETLDSVFIAEFKKPIIQYPSTIEVCHKSEVIIKPIVWEVSGPALIKWSNKETTNEIKLFADSSFNLSVNVVDVNGCSITEIVKIKLFKSIPVSLDNIVVCSQPQKTILINQEIDADLSEFADWNIKWESGVVNPLRFDNPNWYVDFVLNGNTKYSFNGLDKNGCSYKQLFEVTFLKPIKTKSNSIRPICISEKNVKLNVETGLLLDGLWTMADNSLILDGIVDAEKWGVGNYVINFKRDATLTECEYTQTFNMEIVPLPEINELETQKLLPEAICVNASPLVLSAGKDLGKWYGQGIIDNIFNIKDAAINNDFAEVFYSLTSDNPSCTNTKRFFIAVSKPPVLNLKSNSPVCIGNDALIDAEYNVELEELKGPTAFPFVFEQKDNVFKFNTSSQTSEIFLDFTVTAIGKGKCQPVDKQIQIHLIPTPSGNLVADKAEGCAPLQIKYQLNNAFPNNNLIDIEIDGNNGNVVNSIGLNAELTLKNPGIYTPTYRLKYKGCETSFSNLESVKVFEKPIVDFSSDPGTFAMQDFTTVRFYENIQCKDPVNLVWNFPGLMLNSKNPIFQFPNTPGKYPVSLTASSAKGCTGSIEKFFVIEPKLEMYVPSAFSPDAEGPNVNNVFKVIAGNTTAYNLQIFDRWGQKVFETSDPLAVWNGVYNGRISGGVYAWQIKANDKGGFTRKWKGTVTLLH